MGIFHSITGFLGWKTEDEEDDKIRPFYHPYPLHQKHNDKPCNGGDSSDQRAFTILKFHGLIFKVIKGLFQKVRLIFCLLRPRKWAETILPLHNPAPTLSTSDDNPSLLQPRIISDSSSDSTMEISVVADNDSKNVDDAFCENKYPTDREQMDCLIISIPESIQSLACTTASQEIVDSTVVIEEGIAVGVNSAEEKVIAKGEVVVHVDEGIRWIKHYSSHHRILLVGEGDFSFSACLAVAFGWAPNIIATSLDSKAFLKENYKNAVSNIKELGSRGSKVMHGIDATQISDHALLGHLKFDRIVYNFPFAGFFKELSRQSQLRLHRRLVSLFLKNAKEMLSENGEVHISHKSNDFHIEWNVVSIASSHGLRLIEEVDFNRHEYPGYNTKCGFGGDNNFNCYPAKTYKFQLKTLSYNY